MFIMHFKEHGVLSFQPCPEELLLNREDIVLDAFGLDIYVLAIVLKVEVWSIGDVL